MNSIEAALLLDQDNIWIVQQKLLRGYFLHPHGSGSLKGGRHLYHH
ncbi:MAG: hypothetical protein WCG31_06505 [Deltaproteobacteria bacterium]